MFGDSKCIIFCYARVIWSCVVSSKSICCACRFVIFYLSGDSGEQYIYALDLGRETRVLSCFIFSFPSDQIGGGFLVCYFFSSLSLLLFVFFGCSDGMEREACVCDHGFERSDLCAEIIIIIIDCWLKYVRGVL